MPEMGAFLKEKLTNMSNWLTDEVGKENMPFDMQSFVSTLPNVDICILAQILAEELSKWQITHRDWAGLVTLLADNDEIPAHFTELVQVVRTREHLHDKFWRYIELFCEVIHNSK